MDRSICSRCRGNQFLWGGNRPQWSPKVALFHVLSAGCYCISIFQVLTHTILVFGILCRQFFPPLEVLSCLPGDQVFLSQMVLIAFNPLPPPLFSEGHQSYQPLFRSFVWSLTTLVTDISMVPTCSSTSVNFCFTPNVKTM